MRQFRIIAVVLSITLVSLLHGQTDTSAIRQDVQPDTMFERFGYLKVECDSSGLDIFVDGILVGQVPIDEAIPLTRGEHTITYLNPQYLSLLDEYYGEKEMESLISRSFQKVYIVPGQTVSVNLWWRPYERELRTRKQWLWIKSFVGAVIVATLFSLNVQ